jgi:hypothetical protein
VGVLGGDQEGVSGLIEDWREAGIFCTAGKIEKILRGFCIEKELSGKFYSEAEEAARCAGGWSREPLPY